MYKLAGSALLQDQNILLALV